MKGFEKSGLKGNYLLPLTKEELDRIHSASLRILEKTGVLVYEPEAVTFFRNAGCEIQEDRIVHIPSHLIKESIDKAPSKVTLCGRDRKFDFTLGAGQFYGGICGTAPYIIDAESDERREATRQDAANLTRLIDALDNLHCALTPQVVPNDVPKEDIDIHAAETALLNTEKHVGPITCFSERHIEDVIQMAEVVAGGEEELRKRPIISGFAEPVSPLKHSIPQTRQLIAYAKRGIPIQISNHPITGFTSPITVAGTLAQSNAEVLSYLVLAELINPRTPVVLSPYGTAPNMKTGRHLPASVEASLLQCACIQMVRHYGLPALAWSGVNAKTPDAQMGIEDTFIILPAALAGADLVLSGLIDSDESMSYSMFVIENEIFAWVGRFLGGIEVDESRIALDLIDEVGPGGYFLSKKHTAEFFNSEHVTPRIFDRNSWKDWKKAGSKSLYKNANQEAEKILKTHEPRPLDKQVTSELNEVIKRAQKRRGC